MKHRVLPQQRSAEHWRTAMWTWPVVGAVVALGAAVALSRVRPASGTSRGWPWPGSYGAASAVMQAMATSVMTAAALSFSVTVVALQLASQQFSPRLLREFGRDPVTKRVLAILSATFVFTTTTLYALREDEGLPAVSVLLGFLLGLASLLAILGFITHVVRVIRVDTMMLVVHYETSDAIRKFHRPYDDDGVRSPHELPLDEAAGVHITSAESGFLRLTDVEALLQAARRWDAVIRIEVRPGDHVVRGAPIATVWPRAPRDDDAGPLEAAVRGALKFGYERTFDQDAGFGVRQLEDIAVKAMSPSINDPVTAVHAVGHMADILVRLVGCRLGATLLADEAGAARVIVPDRDLRYYLDLACGQLRRFAAAEPTVLIALLRMLRDVAAACRDDQQRAEVRRASALVVEQLSGDVVAADAAAVHDLRDRVALALEGEVHAAYADRAGETRSV